MTFEEANTEEKPVQQIDTKDGAHRPIAKPKNGREVTPEMRAIAEALAHPDGDPYENARRLGFYCENCG